jgi:hypothetical protein
MKIEILEIQESFINGQNKQAVKQIDEYGLYDFWEDYYDYLNGLYDEDGQLEYFTNATIIYFRLKNR